MWAFRLLLMVGLLANGISLLTADGCPDIVKDSRHLSKIHQNVCYLFVNEEKYWNDACSECWEMGGEMLSIRDGSTMTFIKSVLNSRELGWTNNGVWLGATYSSGRWQWTSGVPLTYLHWAPGEPSKTLGVLSLENCALMRRGDNWRWHDYLCSALKFHYNFICEFLVRDSQSTTTSKATSSTSDNTASTRHHLKRIKGSSMPPVYPFLVPRGDGSFVLWNDHDHGEEMHSLVLDHSAESQAGSYPFRLHPAFNVNGHYQAHTAALVKDNGNMTILTIILTTGAIVLLSLLIIFLIVRKKCSLRKTVADPCVLFENHNCSHNSQHLFPAPAPHQFHPTHVASNSHLYLNPTEVVQDGGHENAGQISESTACLVNEQKTGKCVNSNTPAQSEEDLGACGGSFDYEDCVIEPLVPPQPVSAMLVQSEESHSMSSSLTMKTSGVNNEYVDMNGAPAIPAWHFPVTTSMYGPSYISSQNDGVGLDVSMAVQDKPLDPGPDYSNLMSASQRSENLYEQLR